MMSGCSLGGRSFSVLNLKTGQTVHIRGESGHSEVLLRTDDKTKTFCTLYLSDNHAHFVMRTIGYDGQILEKRVVPLFAREYVAMYHVRWGYALSPDGSFIAYLDEQTGGLRVFDLQSGSSRPLVADLTTRLAHVSTLEWLSDRELLVAVDGTSKPYAQILVVDVPKGAVHVDLRPARGSLLAGVLTDGVYLAYPDESCNYDGFRIYDLRKRAEVGEIIPAAGFFAGYGRWAGDGEARLFYVESEKIALHKNLKDLYVGSGKASLHILKQFDVASRESRELRTWNSPSVMYIDIRGFFGSKLFYETESAVFAPRRLFVWDAATQQETEIKEVRTSGTVRIVDHGHRIIWGYWP
jgi:WD40 repeat protein